MRDQRRHLTPVPAGELGLDAEALSRAVGIASSDSAEVGFPKRDIPHNHARLMKNFEHGEIVGPLTTRTGPKGVVLHDGHLVASWGDVDRTESVFSATKSFLSTVAGVAFDRGVIASVDDPVVNQVDDGTFTNLHNAPITWEHLLQNRSEWTGTLFGKPDSADRREGVDRELREPGTFWEYNDVRVNLCAYALLYVLREPLPDVLREAIMDPIGASGTWVWHGYDTSWVEIDGRRVQSVAGGGHWGGGLAISALDMARFGQLYLDGGRFGGRQLLSEEWSHGVLAPSPIRSNYGRFFWLNRPLEGSKRWPSCPDEAFAARGYGGNAIYVDPVNRLVAVTRWLAEDAEREFYRFLMAACGYRAESASPTRADA